MRLVRKTRTARIMKWAAPCLIALAWGLASSCIPPDAGAQGVEKNVGFRWAFGAMTGQANDRRLESVTQDRALKTGDQIKMLVEPQRQCFIYVIHHNSQDEVALLFPYSLEQFERDYAVSGRYYIPRGSTWYELDRNPGTEAFHVLASEQRLTELERLVGELQKADGPRKGELSKLVLAEIRNQKKQHRDLAAPAERPVNIGGAVRGFEKSAAGGYPDVSVLAQDVTANGFYARTFTIDHQ
jgi:hypothetical protein